jgi:hypothetical protein
MKTGLVFVFSLLALAGCVSAPEGATSSAHGPSPAPAPEKINWTEVDKSSARVKEREKAKPASNVTVTDNVESGFFLMSDDDYETALTSATEEIRKANPKMSDSEVEIEAGKRADEARRKYENSYRTRASTSVQWKSP